MYYQLMICTFSNPITFIINGIIKIRDDLYVLLIIISRMFCLLLYVLLLLLVRYLKNPIFVNCILLIFVLLIFLLELYLVTSEKNKGKQTEFQQSSIYAILRQASSNLIYYKYHKSLLICLTIM